MTSNPSPPAFRLSHGCAQYAAQRSALAKSLGLGQLRQRPVATVPSSDGGRIAAGPSPSPGENEAAAVPPASADAIDAAAHGAAGVAAGRAKTKGKGIGGRRDPFHCSLRNAG
jgi:hypothetical protein